MRTSSPFRGALFKHNACVHLFISVKVPANIGCIRLIPHVQLCKNQMANTYTQIHLQFIFGVKYREALIDPNWETELHKYISEI